MDELLRKIGLTEGEIKVYRSLLRLKKSSVGPIIKDSSISASKVYILLDRLVEKGLASFILENNVRQYSPTNPSSILDYLDKQGAEIEMMRKESETAIKKITKELGSYNEESAQIYKGYPGLRVAFDNILNELNPGDEYLFFSVSAEEFTQKNQDFFDRVQTIREERGLPAKGILDTGLKRHLAKFQRRKRYSFKFYNLTLPNALVIGKERILLPFFGDDPIAFEIVSRRIAKKYRGYFNKLWSSI